MEVGQKLEFIYKVEEKDLAKYVAVDEQDQFPEVLATARMVALMEIAAARNMNSLVKEWGTICWSKYQCYTFSPYFMWR